MNNNKKKKKKKNQSDRSVCSVCMCIFLKSLYLFFQLRILAKLGSYFIAVFCSAFANIFLKCMYILQRESTLSLKCVTPFSIQRETILALLMGEDTLNSFTSSGFFYHNYLDQSISNSRVSS